MSKVTVLMTVYNGMPFLRLAVESVLNQTYSNFRFVIVNDGSTDHTGEYLNSLNDPRIKVLQQANGGTAKAANAGLAEIDTPYVARMDADDIAHPERLAKQVAYMDSHDEVGILGAQICPVGEMGTGESLNLPLTHEDIFSAMMKGQHGLAHSVIMIRAEILKQLGGYWQFPLIDDWDMMLRMGEKSKLVNLPDVLLQYRVHSGSLNGRSMMKMHRHISYAIHRAESRQNGNEPIEYDDFLVMLEKRPRWKKISEWLHVHAMANYRVAIADIHGGNPLMGYARLAYAATCCPTRTIQRLKRILAAQKNQNSAASPAAVCSTEQPQAQT